MLGGPVQLGHRARHRVLLVGVRPVVESPGPEYGGYVNFTKVDHYVAGMMHNDGSHGADDQWTVYLASDDAEKSAQAVSDASTFPDDAPLGWSVYFTVADADATIAAVEAAGGAVVIPAEDTPYGRLAAVTDPTGAMFKIVG